MLDSGPFALPYTACIAPQAPPPFTTGSRKTGCEASVSMAPPIERATEWSLNFIGEFTASSPQNKTTIVKPNTYDDK